MSTPQDQGRQFEKDLANEFGTDQVPGSGSVWHSKLDNSGYGARWSLKFTEKEQFPISYSDILEALEACYGIGGDGSIPLWAARVPIGDFVLMRKEDFKDLQEGNVNFINKDKSKVAERKARANLPELLREDD